MKTKLKILYKTPDLDALAEKHQDFDGLMDALLDEKIRRRKKLYRFSSFAIVIIGTAFLSWLYWGYEPASSQPEIIPPQTTPAVVAEEPEETKKTEEVEVLEEQVQKAETQPETQEVKPPQEEIKEPEENPKTEEAEKPVDEDNELAMPSVNISSTERINAKPSEGLEALYEYLYGKVDLPDSIIGESGSFFLEVTFMVKENGDISNVEFSKELPEEVAAGLTQVFLNMPEWKPAREGDKTVDSDVKLPITFQKKD